MCDQSKSGQSYLRSYLDKIYSENEYPLENSLYLPQVMFLKQDLVDKIFSKIDLLFRSTNKNSIVFPLGIHIYAKHSSTQTKGFKFSDSIYDANFTFVISNPRDLKYAESLLSLYTHLIGPFLTANKDKLSDQSERLTRFFYLNGFNQTDVNQNKMGYVGKTFVNAKTSYFMDGPHEPDGPHHDAQSYYLSHFRNRYELGRAPKSIRLLNLDLNYFVCYAKPLLAKLIGSN